RRDNQRKQRMFDRLKNLLRPAETKSSRTARLIALESPGRARWTPRDYAALAREGYLGNAIVHRAVRLVAENAASCALVLYGGGQGAHDVEGSQDAPEAYGALDAYGAKTQSRDTQYRGTQIAGSRARGKQSIAARTPQRLAELLARPNPRRDGASFFEAL